MNPRRFLVAVALLSLSAATAWSCKLPVFRYALERWSVDNYKMVAIVDGERSEADRLAIEQLRSFDSANVEVEVVDLETLTEAELWQLDDFEESTTPRLQVFFPERKGQRRKCWEGKLTAAVVNEWFDSSLRQDIVNDLVAGESAVWLMIDGTDANENDRIAAIVQSGLEQAKREISIPEGVIQRENANEYLRDHPEASMEDVLRCDVPLKVDFRLRRLAVEGTQGGHRELAVRAMVAGLSGTELTGAEQSTRTQQSPVLVPIFGRGRMLDAIETGNLQADTIVNVCRYMVGECSCTVKAQNPGVDMILHADWSRRLGQEELLIVQQPADVTTVLVDIPSGEASGEASDAASGSASGSAPSAVSVGASMVAVYPKRDWIVGSLLVLGVLAVGLFGRRKLRYLKSSQ